MRADIQILDRGRGLQLSTSRITVQDLVPYFQRGCSYQDIRRWIPSLSADEIAVVERYYREHQAELDEEDRRIREQRAERVRQQRLLFPEWPGTSQEHRQHLQKLLDRRRQEKNGEGHSG
jgi:hypothetical protein